METFKLVMPEHLNHHGFLFGGNMLKWVDEYSWIAASFDYPECNFVTIGLNEVEFRKSVQKGCIIRFDINRVKKGKSSVCYQVHVYKKAPNSSSEDEVFSTRVTFVSVDKDGNKIAIP